jgi:phenylpropionate dioxygenase-like ring-hydroxylating dioxygenase large terminal subunit
MSLLQPTSGHDSRDLRRTGIHRDFWYPLARARELKPGRTLAVRFAGEPIVLARSKRGQPFALEDRCAHRQMPLSMGVVVGERLQCGYHSWVYDKSGRCVGIPYRPKGEPTPGGVRSYPCREASGLIFVFPGDPKRAETVSLPQISAWSDDRYRTMYFSRLVRCHYSFMHENLMDMNHQFLHRRLLGRIRPTILETRGGDDWLEVIYRFHETGGRQHYGARFVIRGQSRDPDLPDSEIMTIRTHYPYQDLAVRLPGDRDDALRLWATYVPVDREQRTNRSFGLLMIRRPRLPGLIYFIWPFVRRFAEAVFAQDQMAVETEQRAHDEQGGDWNQEVFPLIRELKALLLRCGGPPVERPLPLAPGCPDKVAFRSRR